jgi:hypothetical protein
MVGKNEAGRWEFPSESSLRDVLKAKHFSCHIDFAPSSLSPLLTETNTQNDGTVGFD